jgi:hypothetical protein
VILWLAKHDCDGNSGVRPATGRRLNSIAPDLTEDQRSALTTLIVDLLPENHINDFTLSIATPSDRSDVMRGVSLHDPQDMSEQARVYAGLSRADRARVPTANGSSGLGSYIQELIDDGVGTDEAIARSSAADEETLKAAHADRCRAGGGYVPGAYGFAAQRQIDNGVYEGNFKGGGLGKATQWQVANGQYKGTFGGIGGGSQGSLDKVLALEPESTISKSQAHSRLSSEGLAAAGMASSIEECPRCQDPGRGSHNSACVRAMFPNMDWTRIHGAGGVKSKCDSYDMVNGVPVQLMAERAAGARGRGSYADRRQDGMCPTCPTLRKGLSHNKGKGKGGPSSCNSCRRTSGWVPGAARDAHIAAAVAAAVAAQKKEEKKKKEKKN